MSKQSNFLNRKGQGLSINVIIIAALALIVLVILVVIFVSQSTDFEQRVKKESQTELIKMRIQYGECRPKVERESQFKATYGAATSDLEGEQAKAAFEQEIGRCKAVREESSCLGSGCVWS